MAKRVLITGGSGFMGINLTRFLLEKGCEVTTIDLVEFDYPDCREMITPIIGDVRKKEDMQKALEGCEAVYHLAAALPLYTEEEIFSTDVGGTRMVLETAHEKGIERVVFISSSAVYGVPDHHPLYETDKMVGVGPYGQAKIDAEGVCAEYRSKGMVVPIIRPKSFIGPERLGVFALFYDWASDKRGFPMIGSGANRYQLLDVWDLCVATHLVGEGDPEKVNDVFNIGAVEFTTMKEDFQAVLDEAGFGKKIRSFPAGPVIFGLKILEALKLSPLYEWVYQTASKDSFLSVDKARETLGWEPKYSNKQALIRNYHWYVENRESFEGQSGISHRVPWKQGALKFFKRFF